MLLRCSLLFLAICQATILSSKNLQKLVSGFADRPADLIKAKAVDKNWIIDVENVYTRIAPETGLFEHKETKEIFFETKENSWNQIELVQHLANHHYRSERLRITGADKFQSFIKERKWSEMMHELVNTGGCKRQTNLDFLDALARIADLDGCDDQNDDQLMETALIKSAYNGKVNHLEILLKHGASVDLTGTDPFSRTPLMNATISGYDRAVKALLSHKANPNLVDKCGESAVHQAAKRGYFHILEMLWNSGAQIDSRSNNLSTPLHHAIVNDDLFLSKGRCACVEFLVNKGANPHLEDRNGQTAIELAKEHHDGCDECLFLLQNADAVAKRHKNASQENVVLRLEVECRKNAELACKNTALENLILQLKIELEETKSQAERNNRENIED